MHYKMTVKILLFTAVWFLLLAGIMYGTIKMVEIKETNETRRLKDRAERDMKALEIAEREYEENL